MQGEKIGEETGKVTSQRVLPNPGGPPKMEVSFQVNATLLGVKARETGTYWSVARPDGTVYGEGQGIVMGEDGHVATWTGQGVGTMKKDGSVSYRGSVFYQSSSAKWSRLNSGATSTRNVCHGSIYFLARTIKSTVVLVAMLGLRIRFWFRIVKQSSPRARIS